MLDQRSEEMPSRHTANCEAQDAKGVFAAARKPTFSATNDKGIPRDQRSIDRHQNIKLNISRISMAHAMRFLRIAAVYRRAMHQRSGDVVDGTGFLHGGSSAKAICEV